MAANENCAGEAVFFCDYYPAGVAGETAGFGCELEGWSGGVVCEEEEDTTYSNGSAAVFQDLICSEYLKGHAVEL